MSPAMHIAPASSHSHLAASRPIPGVFFRYPSKSGQTFIRPVRTRTTSPLRSSTPCFATVSCRSFGVIAYASPRVSTPCIPATSSSTPRAMTGGYLSSPPLFQIRLPRSRSAFQPFQNFP